MRPLACLLLTPLLLPLCDFAASAATLGLQAQPSVAADTIAVPVHLEVAAAEAVAGIQFDLHFDPTALEFVRVEAGDQATAAEKSAHFNELSPGVLRVIIAGLNRNHMVTGPVVTIHLAPQANAPAAATATLSDAILSDPFGTAVPVMLAPQTLVLDHSNGSLAPALATGASKGTSSAPDPYGSFRALVVALLCVIAAIVWTRQAPKKRRKR